MDKDELLISVAASFVDRDLENSIMFIRRDDDNYASVIFSVGNDNTLIADKKMISQTDIEVDIDLKNEAVEVNTVNKDGWIITDSDGYETQYLWENKKTDYYVVLTDSNGKYIQCESYTSLVSTVSIDTKDGSRGHSNYEEKRLGKNRINVVDEYSILDGYPVSRELKSFTKIIYNQKNKKQE